MSPHLVVKPGESLDSVARTMAEGTFRVGQHQQLKAILIQNNQITETTPLRPGQLLNGNNVPCGGASGAWSPGLTICPQTFSPELQQLVQTEAQSLPLMMGLSDQAERAGWDVGIDGVAAGGHIVFAADSGVGASAHMLGQIRLLGRKSEFFE